MTSVCVADSGCHDFRVDFKTIFVFHPAEEAVCRVFQVCIAQHGHSCKAFHKHSRTTQDEVDILSQ